MILADDSLAIYIAAGLAGFLVLLCCCAAIVCKGLCRSFEEPVKSPFEMHMDPASRNEALQNKYEVYHYHLMTPRTPVERHQVKVPTPLIEVTGPTPGGFDFGAVLRMQAMEKANSLRSERHANDPLLNKEHDSSSTDTNNGGTGAVDRIAVDLESNKEEQATSEASVPLMMDSIV